MSDGVRAVGRVAEIWVYPVKSLAGAALTEVAVGPAGLAGDRAHAVVDAVTGERVRPAQAPALAGTPPTADAGELSRVLGRPVRLEPAGAPPVEGTAVHLVSRQARERARAGVVPAGCSADDPRANLLLELTDADERDWVGRLLRAGDAVLRVTRTPKHCLGVYAEVHIPGRVRAGDPLVLLD